MMVVSAMRAWQRGTVPPCLVCVCVCAHTSAHVILFKINSHFFIGPELALFENSYLGVPVSCLLLGTLIPLT